MEKEFTVETLSPLAEHSPNTAVIAHIVKHIVKNDTALVQMSEKGNDYIINVLYGTQLELTRVIAPADYKISNHCSGYMVTMESGINVCQDYFIPYIAEEDSVTAELVPSAYENDEPFLTIK